LLQNPSAWPALALHWNQLPSGFHFDDWSLHSGLDVVDPWGPFTDRILVFPDVHIYIRVRPGDIVLLRRCGMGLWSGKGTGGWLWYHLWMDVFPATVWCRGRERFTGFMMPGRTISATSSQLPLHNLPLQVSVTRTSPHKLWWASWHKFPVTCDRDRDTMYCKPGCHENGCI
jgi:hypothetical protein